MAAFIMSSPGKCRRHLSKYVFELTYTDLRPGWQEFLSSVAKKYDMHVYTMGTRAYAEEVCAAIDPDGSLFGGRILSRDESGSEFFVFTINAVMPANLI